MAYNKQLADRVREYLRQLPEIEFEEKKMFGGLAFMINGKMCVNISDDNLMCRFDPDKTQEIAAKTGYVPMTMKGKEYKGYCYVEPAGCKSKNDFEYWINLCLDYNDRAKSSKKRKNN